MLAAAIEHGCIGPTDAQCRSCIRRELDALCTRQRAVAVALCTPYQQIIRHEPSALRQQRRGQRAFAKTALTQQHQGMSVQAERARVQRRDVALQERNRKHLR